MSVTAPPAKPATALVLGIEGTIVDATVTGKTTAVPVVGQGTAVIPNRVINLLQQWEGPVAFCSDWGTDATRAFLPVFGKTTVLPVGRSEGMWWKVEAVMAWATQRALKGRLLWVDGELEDHREDVAAAVLNASGQGLELIPISTRATGMTDEHLLRILAAARG